MKKQKTSILLLICTRALPALLIAATLLSGCVSRSAYDADIARVAAKLRQERADNAETVRVLEEKIKERGRSLSELTNRYMVLQHERAQFQLSGLKKDMEILLSNLEELSLVVSANLKGSEASEMQMIIGDMTKRVQSVLERERKAKSQ